MLLLGEPAGRVEGSAGSPVVVPVGTTVQLVNDGNQHSLVLIVGAPPSSGPAEYMPDIISPGA